MVQKIFNALLFDTRSIQRYIYSGDRLRTNVGASYIVDRLFFDVLCCAFLLPNFSSSTTATKMSRLKKLCGCPTLSAAIPLRLNCPYLSDYSTLVGKVKEGIRLGLSRHDSIRRAVNFCLDNNIMRD